MANAFYAQSGGVTSVINAQAAALIQAFRAQNKIQTLYAGEHGILGLLEERLIDTNTIEEHELKQLFYTPGGVFGSCRYKLKAPRALKRALEVLKAHQIEYFFYNGGNDSQDTTHKLSMLAKQEGYPLTCIGLPKTIDNDLAKTDTCPGFGSVAKYVSTSTLEATLDVKSMAKTSTKVFILEVMGRHAGWIAAASALSATPSLQTPHMILFPEVAFEKKRFLDRISQVIDQIGYCVIVASEGIQNAEGQFLSETGSKDDFGHAQLGGVAPFLSQMVQAELGLKTHWAVSDYLQRSARHIASKCDHLQACALGEKAIDMALSGLKDVMLTIERVQDTPYEWQVGHAPLDQVANFERPLPKDFISEDGYHLTERGKHYLKPYIEGEIYPEYNQGIPNYLTRSFDCIPALCPPYPL